MNKEKTYEELQEELEKYKEFFDEAPVALFRTDLETGQFLMANRYAANMLGFDTVDELINNTKSTDLYPERERKKLIRKIREEGHVNHYEIQLMVDGEEKHISANMHINCNGTCVEGTFMDITPMVEIRDKNLAMMQKVGEQIEKRITSLAG